MRMRQRPYNGRDRRLLRRSSDAERGSPPGQVRSVQRESHARVEPLIGDWDALADGARATPWLRPGWIDAWWRAFGRGSLELLTLRRDGRLAAVLPLERRFGALRSTSNYHTPGFGLLAEDDAAARDLAGVLFSHGGRRVKLAFLASNERGLDVLRPAAAAAGYRVSLRPLERSPYLAVDGDWARYEAHRPGKLVRELRRRRRRLEEQGRLVLEVADGSERLDELLDEGFSLEALGWKGRRGTAILSSPATRRFYEDVGAWAAGRGWLRLAFLRLDGRPLAFDFCLEADGVHYLVKTGFDPAFGAFAPGTVLRQEMIARAFSTGLTRYEFLGKDEPWKLEWTDDSRAKVALEAFAPSVPGLVDWAAFAFGRPLARRAIAMGNLITWGTGE